MRQPENSLGDHARESLEQLLRRTIDHLAHGIANLGVVDCVGEAIAQSRRRQVGLDLDVDLELLSGGALGVTDAVAALEHHPAELDAVHLGANSSPNRLVGVIRPATEDDLHAINDLYNHYVLESHYTFDDQPLTMDARREWFSHYAATGRHRVFVAVEDDKTTGFATSSRYRPKPGYLTTVETSVYLAPDATGKGIGTQLYETLFKSLEGEDLHRALAGIALPNPQSIGLHEKFGFKRVALYTEQGRKFGRYWDVAWFEKPLEP